MKYRFGFIGVGSMGGALANAVCRRVPGGEVAAADYDPARTEALRAQYGVRPVSSAEAARESKFLFLGVKPQALDALAGELRDILRARTEPFVLVSMAAGVTMERICARFGADCPVIRIMPNTPAAVGEGMILYTANAAVREEELSEFTAAMDAAGLLDRVPEGSIDAATAISGCGPAFVCLFLEALADGGVACGLPRDKALRYAAQTLAGSARLLLEQGRHPGELKDAVCSPGGSTIQGVRALERGGFRSAVFEAVLAACDKTRALGD